MTDKLKPCPFCGGEAKLVHEEVDCDGYFIHCMDCNAHSVGMLTDTYQSRGLDARQEVIKAWNTRKPMEQIIEQLEKISPVPDTKHYAMEDEYTAAFEMHEKCMTIVKGV